MAEVRVARVVLKDCKSYRVGGRRFLKGVPQTVRGEEVELFINNAHFTVRELEPEKVKTPKKKAEAKTSKPESKAAPEKETSSAKASSSSKKTKASLKKRS